MMFLMTQAISTQLGVVNVPLPADLAKEMAARAAKFGMSLPTFLAFISRVHIRHHDDKFVKAVRRVFKKHAGTLRDLAQ